MLWMFTMEVICLFLVTLSLTAAQNAPRNQGFRNQDFRNQDSRNQDFRNQDFRIQDIKNVRAPSSGRDRPFISIPIVLLPDRQLQPKPSQTAYHYVGYGTPNGPNQQNQKNYKQRNPVSKPSADYQVTISQPVSSPPTKKTVKPPKLTSSQLSTQLRNVQSNFPRGQGHGSNPHQNQQHRGHQQQYEQNQSQQIHQVQFKQQRNPTFQQYTTIAPQQAILTHKQNVANFVNFATNIGSALVSQQQNQHVILPTQTPAAGSFQNSPNLKAQESYLMQRPLLANHKLGNGFTFQHQVPSTPNTQLHYAQLIQSNAAIQNNGYSAHQPHSQQQVSNSQSQQQLSNSQPQQQSSNSQQLSNLLQLSNSQHQLSNSQHQLSNSQRQLSNSQHQLSNSQHQLSNSQHQLSNSQPQHQQQQSQQSNSNSPQAGTYLPAASLRANIQTNQGTELRSTIPNEAGQVQQNSNSNLRAQTSQSNAVLLNNYNTHHQQSNNQQNYAVATPQQTNSATQVVNNYDTQTSLPKSVLSVQQPASASAYALNTQNVQASYVNQNQGSQENSNSQAEEVAFPVNSQTSSGYSNDQLGQTNGYSLQNSQSNVGQISDPIPYYQYQTAQELPLNYASYGNQGQSRYVSSQNAQQNDPAAPNAEHSYTFLPNTQAVFVSTGQSHYTNLQEGASNDSPHIGIQGYDIYANEQPVYTPTATSQTQTSLINTQNEEKNYQNSQYNYLLQNSQEQSSDSQNSQSSIGNSPLLYASSAPKQVNYAPQSASSSVSLPYGSSNYQSSPTFVSFSTVSANFKPESPTSENYEQRSPAASLNHEQRSTGTSLNYDPRSTGVVTPGSTYAKLNSNNEKQQEPSTETSETSEDSEYDEGDGETDDEEASYKVVYIPLDILKNILSNTVENK